MGLRSATDVLVVRRWAFAHAVALLMFAASCVQAQSVSATPSLELKKLDIWAGDWTLSGTAKDGPKSSEYKVEWQLHEHWILDGFFLQADQVWKGNGAELHSIEIFSYDQQKRIYAGSGFCDDGTNWVLTGTFDGMILRETVTGKGPWGETSKCHVAWAFSNEGNSLAGTEQCTQKGANWRAFNVTGTKLKSAAHSKEER